MIRLGAVAALVLLAGCAGASIQTLTPIETSRVPSAPASVEPSGTVMPSVTTAAPSSSSLSPGDVQRELILWAQTVSTMTCGEWNEAPIVDQASSAGQLLTGIRQIENANAAPASGDQVAQLQGAITDLCDAGADCSDPNNFCDTASIADAAVGAYVVARDQLRP